MQDPLEWDDTFTLYFQFQVQNAANANQKDKYEQDLKREIKKLQVDYIIIINDWRDEKDLYYYSLFKASRLIIKLF